MKYSPRFSYCFSVILAKALEATLTSKKSKEKGKVGKEGGGGFVGERLGDDEWGRRMVGLFLDGAMGNFLLSENLLLFYSFLMFFFER